MVYDYEGASSGGVCETMNEKDCMKCYFWIGNIGCVYQNTDMYSCKNQEEYTEMVDDDNVL